MISMEKTGARLKRIAEKRGYTPKKLSAEIGVSQNSIYQWYSGQKLPSLDNLCVLSDTFKLRLDDLIVRE